MLEGFREWLDLRVYTVIRGRTAVLGEINRRYSKPRIKMTKGVRIALLFLRVYLLFLVAVLAYAFVIKAIHGGGVWGGGP